MGEIQNGKVDARSRFGAESGLCIFCLFVEAGSQEIVQVSLLLHPSKCCDKRRESQCLAWTWPDNVPSQAGLQF